MSSSLTQLTGNLFVPDLVREAAERSLTIDIAPGAGNGVEPPFGSGSVFIQDVQPGLRCESHCLTFQDDRDFDLLGGPFISGSITLEGNIDVVDIDNYGVVESPLNRLALKGYGEPTRWRRRIRAGQFLKAFSFTLQPEFFERFSSTVEDEQLSVLEPFFTGLHATTLPRSQRLIDLGHRAIDHSYNGSLLTLHYESITLQFVLETIKLLREEELLTRGIGRKHYDRLMHARAILDNTLIDPPKTLHLAHQVGSNINTLQGHFKLAFGTTIFGYVRARRLEMARVLITEHKLGSAQAGYRVGFSNPAAFTAAYRKHFGHPPSAEVS